MSDASKTAEAFLKISSVYKEDDAEVKSAVLESIGEMNICGTAAGRSETSD